MTIEVKVPEVDESITEVEIGDWLKAVGDSVQQDEDLVVIETDKATVEILAPQAGRLSKILKASGETAQVGEVIGHLDQAEDKSVDGAGENQTRVAESPEAKKPKGRRANVIKQEQSINARESDSDDLPEAQAAATESATGSVEPPPQQNQMNAAARSSEAAAIEIEARPSLPDLEPPSETAPEQSSESLVAGATRGERQEKLVPMSPLRRRLAERLVQAQQTAALLTTFNEIDMSAVNQLRQSHQDAFKEKYNVRLGLMSFFVRAAIEALKLIPEVNAEIRDGSIVYRNYFDIGVAVGGGRGLVVPVLRDAQSMSFAAIEIAIGDFARRARENKLKPDELQGGTFTITNGGVYGSLLSTPIINPPQSAILGMHAMQERPVAHDGAVVIRPMMYVALSYDHRLIDGREAVTFLKQIKTALEEPVRMLLEL
jgi:2-oxoglutarate dehydrogenase E2 component (dihydrolipoamide succinyltransferase)